MKASDLRSRLAQAPDDTEVIIEAEKGKKFRVLTAKVRPIRVGRGPGAIFWIATGEVTDWRSEGERNL